MYLCGNSLGLQPRRCAAYVNAELVKWQRRGVEGHFPATIYEADQPLPWVTVDETCVESLARVVGAKPVEVATMNSLSSNLHFMMVSFYRPTQARHKIIIEAKAFPSDHHACESQIRFHGFDPATSLVEIAPRAGEETLRTEDILACVREHGATTALVMLSGVQYYTGQAFEIGPVTAAARAEGCCVGWDLAHAVGNVELKLHEWGPDFACWCTYKYLNSGPGSIGGCFVHERHKEKGFDELPRFAGWWGHRKDDRFVMNPEFVPSPGAFGWQLSNPPVLCLAALRASCELFDAATMPRLLRKSRMLTAYLAELLARDEKCARHVTVLTPAQTTQRGAQLSLVFDQPVKTVFAKLSGEGIICDKREPDVIRIAPAPMYNNFSDVREFVQTISGCLE